MNVVVIGSGITGLMAAAQLTGMPGVQIDILSAGAGASPYIHGFNLPLYEEDSVEVFRKDTLESGHCLSDPELVECLCNGSLELLPDLKNMGLELKKKDGSYELLKPLGSTWPRVVSTGNHTGVDILKRLKEQLSAKEEVRFHNRTRVLRLLVKEGRPEGVLFCEEGGTSIECLPAQCVILACGGFCGIYPFSTNSPDMAGDGVAMAYEAGLRLIDLEFIQFEPSVALYPEGVYGKSVITTMFYEGAVLRNGRGERFMGNTQAGERVNKDVLSRIIQEEILKGNATGHGGVYFDATGVGTKKLMESYPSYVKRYRSVGMDIASEPFEIAPAPHTSLGGVMIDSNCATNISGIFAAGEVAGGLHGANRIGGNAGLETLVFGKRAGLAARRYLLAQDESGRPAEDGCAAPAYRHTAFCDAQAGKPGPTREEEARVDFIQKMQNSFDENRPAQNMQKAIRQEENRREEIRLEDIRGRMQALLSKHFNVIRDGSGMESAKAELGTLLKEVRSYGKEADSYRKLRLENDLTCAWLLANAACARKESAGCHVRSDSRGGDHHYHVVLQKDGDELKISREKS